MIKYLVCVLAMAAALPARGDQWTLGAGYADFSDSRTQDAGILSLEYHSIDLIGDKRLRLGWASALTVFDAGDVHLGMGAVGYVSLGAGWFSEISLMPGIYKDWGGSDLGSEFQVRSLIAIGKRFKNGQVVSLALTHKSNASTAARNPGVDSLLLRWHVPFN
ncbi:MAG: acyloxyacyl hydrolase [Rhodobacteraceae bacterium]|nr:acyloxyacyl hydrolase [Paracoccaceae bacterium]